MTSTASRDAHAAAGRRLLTSPAVRVAFPVAVVVAIFAGVLPQMTDYAEAGSLVASLSATEVVVIAVLAVLNLASYALLWMAALPGLGWWRATVVEQASTAVANTIPAGFAFGLGTTATMYHSFGFSAGTITRAVALTGIWNNLVKLGMPVVALAGLALTGQATRALLTAAVLGLVLLLVALLVLVLVLRGRRAAAALAGAAERLVGRVARRLRRRQPSGWVATIDRFRSDSVDVVQRRWPHLTVAAVASHLALFVLLLACIRLVDGAGGDVSWLRVLAVFSITRLVTLVQITPGAIGVAELSYVAGLTAVGMAAPSAGAAVLVFRFLTWFLPIPCGAVALVLWRRWAGVRPAPEAAVRVDR